MKPIGCFDTFLGSAKLGFVEVGTKRADVLDAWGEPESRSEQSEWYVWGNLLVRFTPAATIETLGFYWTLDTWKAPRHLVIKGLPRARPTLMDLKSRLALFGFSQALEVKDVASRLERGLLTLPSGIVLAGRGDVVFSVRATNLPRSGSPHGMAGG